MTPNNQSEKNCFYCNMDIPALKDDAKVIFEWHLRGHPNNETNMSNFQTRKLEELKKELGISDRDMLENKSLLFFVSFLSTALKEQMEMVVDIVERQRAIYDHYGYSCTEHALSTLIDNFKESGLLDNPDTHHSPSSTETAEEFLPYPSKTPEWESIHPLLHPHMDNNMFSDEQIGEINEMLEKARSEGKREEAESIQSVEYRKSIIKEWESIQRIGFNREESNKVRSISPLPDTHHSSSSIETAEKTLEEAFRNTFPQYHDMFPNDMLGFLDFIRTEIEKAEMKTQQRWFHMGADHMRALYEEGEAKRIKQARHTAIDECIAVVPDHAVLRLDEKGEPIFLQEALLALKK